MQDMGNVGSIVINFINDLLEYKNVSELQIQDIPHMLWTKEEFIDHSC